MTEGRPIALGQRLRALDDDWRLQPLGYGWGCDLWVMSRAETFRLLLEVSILEKIDLRRAFAKEGIQIHEDRFSKQMPLFGL